MNVSFGTHVDLKGYQTTDNTEKKVKFNSIRMPENVKKGIDNAVKDLKGNGKKDSVEIQYTTYDDGYSYMTISTKKGISAFQPWNFIGKKPEEIKEMLIDTYIDLTKNTKKERL